MRIKLSNKEKAILAQTFLNCDEDGFREGLMTEDEYNNLRIKMQKWR